jgi:hypothetical protein
MARCKYIGCRDVIERVGELTIPGLYGLASTNAEWVLADGDMSDRERCPGGGSEGRHAPAYRALVEYHPGDEHHGDKPWCDYVCGGFGDYLVAGEHVACAEHLARAVDSALANAMDR